MDDAAVDGQYGRLAPWYDALHAAAGRDHAAEARALLGLVADRGVVARSLLDVACGTGLHLATFAERVERVVGTDLSTDVLAVAAGRLPEVELHRADMRALDLGERFDVVTCLSSAIGHVADADELDAAVAAMAAHVAPGGLLLVEPWLQPEDVDDDARSPGGHRFLDTARTEQGVVARAARSRLDGDALLVDLAWSLADEDGVHAVTERSRMPLFTRERYLLAVAEAELVPGWHELDELGAGRGLLVGRRPGRGDRGTWGRGQ